MRRNEWEKVVHLLDLYSDEPKACPRTLHPAPYTLHPIPYTLHPQPAACNPQPATRNPTPHSKPKIPNLKPQTPNPETQIPTLKFHNRTPAPATEKGKKASKFIFRYRAIWNTMRHHLQWFIRKGSGVSQVRKRSLSTTYRGTQTKQRPTTLSKSETPHPKAGAGC